MGMGGRTQRVNLIRLLFFMMRSVLWIEKAPLLRVRLRRRGFISIFRNLCLDPPVEMRLVLRELDQLKKLVTVE